MKILVTGSSGHLGEALMRTLKTMNFSTIGIDILPFEFTGKIGSITDRAFVKKCMKDVDVVLHTATLHKPHVVTHSIQDFIDTNITGTLHLLEEAVLAKVKAFIFTSTTSTFGDAMKPAGEGPAVWVTEELKPIPKNIYGVTKTAAEDLCQLFYRDQKLPCIILKTSRFFPEEDDNKARREKFSDENIKANEFLNRRVDIEDVVSAHLLAMEKAAEIGFGKYIISATTPFSKKDLKELNSNAPQVLKRIFPDFEKIYKTAGWEMFPKIGRVYVNERARNELGWQPKYDFRNILDGLKNGKNYRSPLAELIRPKGYHEEEFDEGPYPV